MQGQALRDGSVTPGIETLGAKKEMLAKDGEGARGGGGKRVALPCPCCDG
jgi:hypothetical protein